MATIFLNITKHFFKVLCYIFFISAFTNIKAQTNLVLNPSFEQYTTCPNNTSANGILNSKPDDWYKPDRRGAVYLNICQNLPPHLGIPYNSFGVGFSYQYPRTGDAYVGLSYLNSDHHTYIQTQLTDSCRKNKKYYAEYYVNLTNGSKYGCNNIGILFTKNIIYADTNGIDLLLANPQILNYKNPIVTDTFGWVKIRGIFTAEGGEQYLTLGNFKSQLNTQIKNIQPFGYDGSGYYVDDVAVYALDSFQLKADAGRDTTITIGDSVFIGSYTNGIDTIRWLQNGIVHIDSTRPGFWVKPLANTCYVLTQTVNGYTSSDTVCVNVQPLPLKFISFSIFPSGRGVRGVFTTANEINVSHFNIQRSTNGKDFITIGKQKANNKVFNDYSFIDDKLPTTTEKLTLYYRIQSVDRDGRKTYSQVKSVELKVISSLSVFPNPAKDVVNIVGTDIKEVRLFDMVGKEIASSLAMTINGAKTNHLTLNTNHYPKGLYIVQVVLTNGTIKNEKLIVE